ncbi:MATH domain and coiled-coil domain-containing protein At3g58270-like isoform X2 [Gastrolobium bilobum]|nr:MATH domain and coiled-coil domain-containing protein At3g58270-like isoform X2 [Gastrolobium bilobum]XP_061372169.1 MATH domain and coiled-coil domain-containing protein At3g58270-like isoform X2 [Gastrolobium bilobum]
MDRQNGTEIDFETFPWKIENFSKQDTKNLRSRAFRIRGYKWRILLYPLRNDVEHFSLYLTVAGSLPPYGWSRNTYFKLALINQVDGNRSIVKEAQQRFNGGYRSWGSFFMNLKDFCDSEQGYLVNDTCIIEAHICVSDNNGSILSDQETESSDGSSRYSQMEEEVEGSDLTLRDLLVFESLGREAAAFLPLLEEACTWHPSLLLSQRKNSSLFKLWAFTSLGQVLHVLKTRKVKDMNEDECNHLQGLWEELVRASGFKLDWLEPHVQSALGVKVRMERTVAVNELKDRVVALEIKMERLRGELAAAEDEFEVARRELVEARTGYMEIDLNAELGYAMF